MVGELMDKFHATQNNDSYELDQMPDMEYEKQTRSFSIDSVNPLESKLSNVLSLTESDEHRQIMKDLFTSKQESTLLKRATIPQKLSLSDEKLDWESTEGIRPSNRLAPLDNPFSSANSKFAQRRRGSMPAVLSSSGDKPSLLTRQRLLQHNSLMLPKISENTRPQSPATVISARTNYTVTSIKSSLMHDEYLKRRVRGQRRKSFSCSRSDSFSVASSEDFLSEIKSRKSKQKWRKMIHQRKGNLFAKKEEVTTKLPKLA